jgi:hypothetical protein
MLNYASCYPRRKCRLTGDCQIGVRDDPSISHLYINQVSVVYNLYQLLTTVGKRTMYIL